MALLKSARSNSWLGDRIRVLLNPAGDSELTSYQLAWNPAHSLWAPRKHMPVPRQLAFPDEDGAAILVIEVPDEIIALAVDDVYLPLSQGIVQFDRGAGLEELCAAWATLPKEIVLIEGR